MLVPKVDYDVVTEKIVIMRMESVNLHSNALPKARVGSLPLTLPNHSLLQISVSNAHSPTMVDDLRTANEPFENCKLKEVIKIRIFTKPARVFSATSWLGRLKLTEQSVIGLVSDTLFLTANMAKVNNISSS